MKGGKNGQLESIELILDAFERVNFGKRIFALLDPEISRKSNTETPTRVMR